MQSRFFRTGLALGLLTMIGPAATDIYLPALPSIQHELHAAAYLVQLSMMIYFVSFGIGQLFWGPLSDSVGRKTPIYIGLVLYMLGAIGCATANDIHVLIGFRLLQGLGACACVAVPRAMVIDMYQGPDAARMMSLLILVMSVSPVLAPLVGSYAIQWVGWHGVFWAITVVAMLILLLAALPMKETRPPERRTVHSVGALLAAYASLFKDPRYLGLIAINSFAMASYYIYMANSSFLLIGHYGLTPHLYAVLYMVTALAFILCAQLVGRLAARMGGLVPLLRFAVSGYTVTMLLLVALNLAGVDRLDVMMALLAIGYGFSGLLMPSSAVLALQQHGKIAGTASGLMGACQFLSAALIVSVVGFFINGTPRPVLIGIALCALLVFVSAWFALRQRPTNALATPAPEPAVSIRNEAG